MQQRQIGTVRGATNVTGEATRTEDMSRCMGLQGVVEEVEVTDLTRDVRFDATRTTKTVEKHSLTITAAARNRWCILPDAGGVAVTTHREDVDEVNGIIEGEGAAEATKWEQIRMPSNGEGDNRSTMWRMNHA
jgi:hypothetical protein